MRRRSEINPFNSRGVYVMPVLHLMACILTATLELPWLPIAKIEFPVGPILVGVAWRFGHPLFWFGIFGTVWFYLLSIFLLWLWKY
jgi:hypothetical protein